MLRLLGGSTYWSYGFERIKETAQFSNIALFILPGDNAPDLDLISHSTVPLTAVNHLWRYLIEGGRENYVHALQFLSDTCLQTNYNPAPAKSIPELGIYQWQEQVNNSTKFSNEQLNINGDRQCGILFYRSHYLAGNTLPIDSLCQSLIARNLHPVPIFISSLRNVELQQQLLALLQKMTVKVLFYHFLLFFFIFLMIINVFSFFSCSF